jgi:hypothetical protein
MHAQGQAPGYLGMRNVVGYSLNLNSYLSLGLMTPQHRAGYAAYRHQTSPDVSILTRHQLEFERVVTRGSTVGVGIFYTRTAEVVDVHTSSEVEYATVGSQTIGFFPSVKYFVTGRGSVAPVGAFLEIVVGVMHTRFQTDRIVDQAARMEVLPLVQNRAEVFYWLSFGDAIAIGPRTLLTLAMDVGWTASGRGLIEEPSRLIAPAGRALMPNFQLGLSRTM